MVWVQVRAVPRFPAGAGDREVVVDIRRPVYVVWILEKFSAAGVEVEALEEWLNKHDRVTDMRELVRLIAAFIACKAASRSR